MPTIRVIGTAVPEHIVTQECVRAFTKHFFSTILRISIVFLDVFVSVDIETRYICVPIAWFQEPHSFVEKNSLYVKEAVRLCKNAIKTCFQEAKLTPHAVDEMILVSTTAFTSLVLMPLS
jgi:alkylresorcinol/alkylpyrone synthase